MHYSSAASLRLPELNRTHFGMCAYVDEDEEEDTDRKGARLGKGGGGDYGSIEASGDRYRRRRRRSLLLSSANLVSERGDQTLFSLSLEFNDCRRPMNSRQKDTFLHPSAFETSIGDADVCVCERGRQKRRLSITPGRLLRR